LQNASQLPKAHGSCNRNFEKGTEGKPTRQTSQMATKASQRERSSRERDKPKQREKSSSDLEKKVSFQ
jgi:hypothetical protein